MLKKFVIAFAILAVAVACAGTVPAIHSFKILLTQDAVVNGANLKAGEYRLNVEETKITLVKGKQTVEVPAKVEAADKKFEDTAIRYVGNNIQEIRLGGTKTRITVTPSVTP